MFSVYETISQLLSALEIHCIITVDAMGCQRSMAKVIRDKGADYMLSERKSGCFERFENSLHWTLLFVKAIAKNLFGIMTLCLRSFS